MYLRIRQYQPRLPIVAMTVRHDGSIRKDHVASCDEEAHTDFVLVPTL
jgi:hypothetical protein